MPFFRELFGGKKRKESRGLSTADIRNHHCFGGELLADGFISPIVLPRQRIEELMGEISPTEFAGKCRISEDSLRNVMENDFLEPTALEYFSIARTFGVSIMWLMGYHTVKERRIGTYDQALMKRLSQRNMAETRLVSMKKKSGVFVPLIRDYLERKIYTASMNISNLAARITAKEHLPLSDAELYLLTGQPVFLEYPDGITGWGIPDGTNIVTITGTESIELNEQKFFAFLTPDTAAKFNAGADS